MKQINRHEKSHDSLWGDLKNHYRVNPVVSERGENNDFVFLIFQYLYFLVIYCFFRHVLYLHCANKRVSMYEVIYEKKAKKLLHKIPVN